MSDYPIIPPPEQVQQWVKRYEDGASLQPLFYDIFQAGANQELEACCEWLSVPCPSYGRELRNARRPKPPSLKEQALQALNDAVKMADDVPPEGICSDQANIIRHALEQLDD
jgi:hypothetical protein